MGFPFLLSVKATVLQQNNKRSLVKDYTAWQRKPTQIQDITLGHVEEWGGWGGSDICVRKNPKLWLYIELGALQRQSGQAATGLQYRLSFCPAPFCA